MDWNLAITRNCEALQRIIAAQVAIAGLAEGRAALPRHLHSAILRILRPAESAVRRLIMIAAHGLVLAPRPLRSAPVGIIPKAGWDTNRIPSFCLIDPLKRFVPSAAYADDANDFWTADDGEPEDDTTFALSLPRISLPGIVDPVFAAPKPHLPDGLINVSHLARRLLALKNALDTLPKQARRLARWQARRNLLRKQIPPRPLRLSPFRPGSPPGAKLRHSHEVDGILRECQGLMMDRLAEADTS